MYVWYIRVQMSECMVCTCVSACVLGWGERGRMVVYDCVHGALYTLVLDSKC